MRYSGTSKYRDKKARNQNRNKNTSYYDEDDDDEDIVHMSNNNRNNRNSRNTNNTQQLSKKRTDTDKFEIVGEVVKIKTNRKEIYHDGEGNRTYGSWQ